MPLYIYPNPYKVKHQVDPNVKYGFWVIMTCQCRFTSCAKCIPLVGMSTMEKAIDTWGQRVHREFLHLLFSFAEKLKE